MSDKQRWERAFAQHNEILKFLEPELVCLLCGVPASECTNTLHGMAEAHQWQSKETQAA